MVFLSVKGALKKYIRDYLQQRINLLELSWQQPQLAEATMRANLKSDTVWFNTMPTIGDGGHSLPGIEVTLEPEEVLPEGKYELEVRLKGPDGKEQTATTRLVVAHAC